MREIRTSGLMRGKEVSGHCLCALIPWLPSLLYPPGTPLEGRTWCVSFSRYDYSSAEKPPVLSSTSPHTGKVSFHCQQDWTELSFC